MAIWKKLERVSYIKLSKIREAQIQSCFKCNVEFHYPKNTIELQDIIEELKILSKAIETVEDNNDSVLDYLSSFYGQNNKKRSEKSASFLTVTRISYYFSRKSNMENNYFPNEYLNAYPLTL